MYGENGGQKEMETLKDPNESNGQKAGFLMTLVVKRDNGEGGQVGSLENGVK